MMTIRPARFMPAVLLASVFTLAMLVSGIGFAAEVTKPFSGNTVNGGTVTHEVKNGKHILTLSNDFKVPGSPDPHWQIVDSKGTVYLLDKLRLKDDKVKTSVIVPAYVPDIAKVQMWCAWAEVVLGDAPFERPVMAQMVK